MTTILTLLPWIFIGAFILVVLLMILREIRTPRLHGLQREVDLRLTYKRYLQIYPGTRMSYEEYKKMQSEKAYKKAVSSTKIKRMVR